MATPGGSGVVGSGAVGRGAGGRAGGGPDRLMPDGAEGLEEESVGGPRGPADSGLIGVRLLLILFLPLSTLLSLPLGGDASRMGVFIGEAICSNCDREGFLLGGVP